MFIAIPVFLLLHLDRDMHIQLLEDALQEISTSYRTVVESNERNNTTRKLQSGKCNSNRERRGRTTSDHSVT